MTRHSPWTTLSFRQILDTPYLKIRCEQVAVPNGPIIPDYYIIENRGWVGIVPVMEDGRFLINKQVELLAHMHANPTGAKTRIWWYLARNVRKTGDQKVDPVEVIENLLITPKELLDLIHEGTFAGQGQIAAAYMALEQMGYFTFN